MENNKLTAVEWLVEQVYLHPGSGWPKAIEKALEMEREQHGETWDAALIAVDRRGGVLIRALMDFDKYWGIRNTPDSEGVSQPEAYPEGRE
jgi:hypothetical protein